MYVWNDGLQNAYPLPAMCATLDVSLSGYQTLKRRGTPNRKRRTDIKKITLIRAAIQFKFKGAYGSPRMPEEVRDRGFTPTTPNQPWTAEGWL